MKKVLVTGGAGFIGSNIASFYLSKGIHVTVLDNLSRKGVGYNLEWLREHKLGTFSFCVADVRNKEAVAGVFKECGPFDYIVHCAGQVAVTTSITNPREDFESNVLGTFNILEATRLYSPDAVLLYTSTNKVYGDLSSLEVTESERRYAFSNPHYQQGVSESQSLSFHSPYGCSKGAAEQYVHDYARIYGLSTIVFRQSCIYGIRQMGMEDQGWVVWFLINLLRDKKVTVYGNGKQVRDILYIEDLVRACDMAYWKKDHTKGNIYNIGGGVQNSLSLLEFFEAVESLTGKKINFSFAPQRAGDQHIYISNCSAAARDFQWMPNISHNEGISRLYEWLAGSAYLFESQR